jgi:hypothetical protein
MGFTMLLTLSTQSKGFETAALECCGARAGSMSVAGEAILVLVSTKAGGLDAPLQTGPWHPGDGILAGGIQSSMRWSA